MTNTTSTTSRPRETHLGIRVKKYSNDFIGPREKPKVINPEMNARFVAYMKGKIDHKIINK